jgi:hypothetical protein
MARLKCIALLLLVFGARPAFPATIVTGYNFFETVSVSESVTEMLSQTFNIAGFQSFGVAGMLQDVRISGITSNTAGIGAFNNTDEEQFLGVSQLVLLSIGSGVDRVYLMQGGTRTFVDLMPGQFHGSGEGELGSVEGLITRPSQVALFQSAGIDVTRNWFISADFGGLSGLENSRADFDYAATGTIEYDYIPGPEPGQIFPVSLGLLGLATLWRRRSAAASTRARSKFRADRRPR